MLRRSKYIGFPFADPNDPLKSTYPAGSFNWSGTGTRVPVAVNYWTPGPTNAPTAQEFNWAVGTRDEATLDLLALAGQLDAVNWGDITSYSTALASTSGLPMVQFAPPVWHALFGFWIVAYKNSGGAVKVACSSNGKVWSAFGGSTLSALPDDLSFNPTTGTGLAIGNGTMGSLAAGTQTWAGAGSWGGFSATAGTSGTVFFRGVHVVFANFLTSTAILCGWSATAQVGDNFTNATGTLFSVGANGQNYPLYAASSTKLLIASQSDSTHYTYSGDGKAFSQGTWPAFLASEQVVGLACDQDSGTFYVLLSNGTNSSRLFSSTDGVTWTLASTLGKRARGLAANGATLVTMVHTVSASRAIVSSDGAGATWHWTGLGDIEGSSLGGGSFLSSSTTQFRSNGCQFLGHSPGSPSYAASTILDQLDAVT